MLVKKFEMGDDEIIKSTSPIVIFESELGAMGIPGTIFIANSDITYCLNYFKEQQNDNLSLWNTFSNLIKESRRKLNFNEYEDIYLGCGNEAIIRSDLFKKLLKIKEENSSKYNISAFKEVLENELNLSTEEIVEACC